MEKLLYIINSILENRNKPTLSQLSENFDLRNDIGFDSLDLAELTAKIEAEYDVDIFEDGLVFTISDIIKKIFK